MFDEFKQDESVLLKEYSAKSKHALMTILGDTKALLLMILSVISFGISAFIMIQFISADIVVTVENQTVNLSDFNFIFYIALILSALVPLFYLGVYLSARKINATNTAKWFGYAKVYMKIALVIAIIALLFGFIGMVGVLFVMPGLGLFLMLLFGGLTALVVWLMLITISFLRELKENLEAENIYKKANPSKVIVLSWISLVLAGISLLMSLFDQGTQNGYIPQALYQIVNQASLLLGLIGLVSTALLISILYDIKNKYTNI